MEGVCRMGELGGMREMGGVVVGVAGRRWVIPGFARIRGGRLSLRACPRDVVVGLIAGDSVKVLLGMGANLSGGTCADKAGDFCPVALEETKALQHTVVLSRGPHLADLCGGVRFSGSRGGGFRDVRGGVSRGRCGGLGHGNVVYMLGRGLGRGHGGMVNPVR